MLTRLLFITLLCSFWAVFSFGQVYTAENGTIIEVTDSNTDVKNIPKLNLFFGILFDSRPRMLGLSYFSADNFFIKAQSGFGSVGLDGNYFFKSWNRDGKLNVILGNSNFANYKAKLKVPRRVSAGLHGGFDYHYPGRILPAISPDDFPANQSPNFGAVYFGGSLLNSMFLSMETKGGFASRRGSRLFRMNLDGVYRFVPENTLYNFADDVVTYGARFYVDASQSSWTEKGIFTFNYIFGVGTHWDRTIRFMVIAGFGFGFNFLH